MVSETSSIRTYGGWRRTRGIGLGGLDTRATVAVISAVGIVTLATAVAGPAAGLVLLPIVLIAVGVTMWKHDGVPLMDYISAAVRYRMAKARGETSYRGMVLQPWPAAGHLPGVLASTELLDVEVPGRDRCGLVWDRRSGLISGTLILSTGGTLLTDPDTSEAYVTSWGTLLASLSDVPAIKWAAVTVDITPDAGPALAHDVASRVDPNAPALARSILGDLVQAAPAASARVSTRLTLTIDPTLGPERIENVADGAAATLRVLDGLNTASAGAEVVRRATAADLARIVRSAFDPEVRHIGAGEWDQQWDTAALTWGAAGPMGAEEEPDVYRHENAHSISWALLEAPRQKVAHNVLVRLLSPGQYSRRVTLLFRVLGRDEAGELLERESTAADTRAAYRARTKRDENARERKDRNIAHISAEEEASGAGLAQFSLFVTTTVTDPDQLPNARAEVENAAASSRLKLRMCRFSQAAAFAVGLPAGIYPPHVRAKKGG